MVAPASPEPDVSFSEAWWLEVRDRIADHAGVSLLDQATVDLMRETARLALVGQREGMIELV